MYGISYDAFENCGMKDIYLGNNAFTLFPQVIQTKLFEIIDLTDNDITEIPTGYLAGQTFLGELYLANNQLEYLEDGVFGDLVAMRILSITSNSLNTLPEGLFVNMTNLEELYLSNNLMTHLHSLGDKQNLQKVNVGSNNIGTLANSAFSGLTSLAELNLGNNPLECSCQMVSALEPIASAVTSGTCSHNDLASGATFAAGSSDSPSYFLSINNTFFQC
ncbi:carboxypeptidase N subunit 2-like, partial [Ruditapes philippinarum]|uniref:carboxypeptidase N subunit 2-like n=1 Tax=Ruditapes philippinarum TaxID=129788 RepID=UPI00295BBD4A